MIFYKNIFYLLSLLHVPTVLLRKELRVDKSGFVQPSPCEIGLRFFTVLNNTSSQDLNVELIPDECCLTGGREDCDSIQILGECSEAIPRETTKALTLVAPLVDPFERIGYCTIHVDSRPADRKISIMRDTLNIHFDTRIKRNLDDVTQCMNKDEDPLNDCKPVNCETYYNGKKSFYDKHSKRCIEVPPCVGEADKSNLIYDPQNNLCVPEEAVDDDDIAFIKSLSNNDRHQNDILIIESVNKVAPEKTEKDCTNYNIVNDTKAAIKKVQNKILYQTIEQYLTKNRYTLIVLGLVIVVQCCMIVTMIYCLTNNASCCNKKTVERKFFNYRQDVSVTTPLIGTSNVDTETTQFDYISESSKNDQKIKCYKACQKEMVNNANMIIQDDILSKCLNRRSWISKPNSETREANAKNVNEDANENKNDDGIICNKDCTCINNQIEHLESESAASEKIIKCHNYNLKQPEFKAVDLNVGHLKTTSISTEKGAQAYFSNDSIDDILSERGMIFLGENASKYSFTSNSSPGKSSMTEMTSKTSKNNIIKQVLSFLSKSKGGTSSEPGARKTKSKNLELLHMSQASAYSSDSVSNNVKGAKLNKDARSTF